MGPPNQRDRERGGPPRLAPDLGSSSKLKPLLGNPWFQTCAMLAVVSGGLVAYNQLTNSAYFHPPQTARQEPKPSAPTPTPTPEPTPAKPAAVTPSPEPVPKRAAATPPPAAPRQAAPSPGTSTTIPGTVRENPKDGLKYVWIPPGTFMMGCSPGDSECFDQEKPAHRVTITKGFWMGQTVVTVQAYKRFTAGAGQQMPSAPYFNSGWANQYMPIVNVTWDDSQAYCKWTGGRLPTEAEWEYAARAGSTEARHGPLNELAWYADNSGRQRLDSAQIWKDDQANYFKRLAENGNGTHEVAEKRANGFGLYDTLGNVWEWVNDWYDAAYYQNSPSQDPMGSSRGQTRGMRGGSWNIIPGYVRVSDRVYSGPADRHHDGGVRCVWGAAVTP